MAAYLPLRRAAKTMAMAAASLLGDSPLFLVDYLLRLARVAVLLSIWRVILSSHGTVSGYSLGAVLTYTLIAEVFAEQLECSTILGASMWDGSIATRMLQPGSLVWQFGWDMVGRWLPGLALLSLPLLLCAPVLGADPRPANPFALAGFFLSMLLSVILGLAMEFIFAGLVMALEQNPYVVSRIRQALTIVLSGSLLPLALLPWGLGSLFAWLPFASLASAPLRIYTGTGDVLPLIALQAVWSLALWPLAHAIWRAHREKLVGYGG